MIQDHPDVLFVPYDLTCELLTPTIAMDLCEDVFRMHARQSVRFSQPVSLRMDVGAPYHNHWHVKAAQLDEVPVTGLRLYNYHDDGEYNNVGYVDCARYVFLADPLTGRGLAIVDEHWSYAIRSAAAAVVACRKMGPADAKVLGLIGCGTMCANTLRCLATLYRFDEIRVSSRRRETRENFAILWAERLNTRVVAVDTTQETAEGADIVVGGTTSSEVFCKEIWLKPGSTFISLARRELDPADWRLMDKVVVDSWAFAMAAPVFRQNVEAGLFAREDLYAEIAEVVAGAKPGRASAQERILIHTTGLVSQDLAIANWLYERAREKGLGLRLPSARHPFT